MRQTGLWLLTAAFAFAQSASAPGLVRGVLLERDTQTPDGELSVRLRSHQVFRYLFDPHTSVERYQHPIEVAGLRPGENVEVVSDTIPGSPLRYARAIHVLEDPPSGRRAGRVPPDSFRDYPGEADRLIPTGDLTYSGVVYHLAPGLLVLHTRAGEQLLKLRKDTLFLADGEKVGGASLRLNMRVFVRAGRDLYDQVEAYQVIWGKILQAPL